MKEFEILNPESSLDDEIKTYSTREAARAVVIDDSGMVALLHVTRENYYKLPGGGIEESEDKITGLKRECKEELGCEIEILDEIGSITEYRKKFNLVQTSYCYLAKLKGEKGKPHYMDDEIEKGFEPVWMPYDEALEALKSSTATTFEASAYIVPRDILLLSEAKNLLTRH